MQDSIPGKRKPQIAPKPKLKDAQMKQVDENERIKKEEERLREEEELLTEEVEQLVHDIQQVSIDYYFSIETVD